MITTTLVSILNDYPVSVNVVHICIYMLTVDQTTDERRAANIKRLESLFSLSRMKTSNINKIMDIIYDYCLQSRVHVVDMMNYTCIQGICRCYINTIVDMGTIVLYQAVCYPIIGRGDILVCFFSLIEIVCDSLSLCEIIIVASSEWYDSRPSGD